MADYEDRVLIDYLPGIVKDVREYQAITTAEQPEIFALFSAIDDVLNNQFVSTATEYGVKRWEKILQIASKVTFTLDERKFTILTRLNEQLPFSYRKLQQMLAQLCGTAGFSIDLQNDIYTLNVAVTLVAKNNFNDVNALLHRVTPENMIINLTLKYNTWGAIKGFTWGHIKTKTWREIKEEVL